MSGKSESRLFDKASLISRRLGFKGVVMCLPGEADAKIAAARSLGEPAFD